MSKVNNGGPAFPLPLGDVSISPSVTGLTVRDYFAAKAMPVLLRAIDSYPDETWRIGVALEAYMMADAMLYARQY